MLGPSRQSDEKLLNRTGFEVDVARVVSAVVIAGIARLKSRKDLRSGRRLRPGIRSVENFHTAIPIRIGLSGDDPVTVAPSFGTDRNVERRRKATQREGSG